MKKLGPKLLGLVAPVLLVSLLATPAHASPAYPLVIKAELSLTETPACTLCHRDEVGGKDTVTRPFGRTMMATYALTGGSNLSAVRSALAAADADHVDSDGDGAADVDELRSGMNPNVGATGVESTPDIPLPETGCTFGKGSPSRPAAPLLALALAALLVARRRSSDLSATDTRPSPNSSILRARRGLRILDPTWRR